MISDERLEKIEQLVSAALNDDAGPQRVSKDHAICLMFVHADCLSAGRPCCCQRPHIRSQGEPRSHVTIVSRTTDTAHSDCIRLTTIGYLT